MGLHSLQDKFAHRSWDTGHYGTIPHPTWYDDVNDSRNTEALKYTGKASITYIKRFMNAVNMR
jgi:hypothetical protein